MTLRYFRFCHFSLVEINVVRANSIARLSVAPLIDMVIETGRSRNRVLRAIRIAPESDNVVARCYISICRVALMCSLGDTGSIVRQRCFGLTPYCDIRDPADVLPPDFEGKHMNRRHMMRSTLLASLAATGRSAFAASTTSNEESDSAMDFRQETDSLGVANVRTDKLWSAQTQRSLEGCGENSAGRR